jgi:aquaporin Z
MLRALRSHWPEYLMEAALLGLFMVSAGLFGTLLGHPQSPAHRLIADPFVRRLLMGVAMGLTAVGLIYSPWGRQSGAHFNPATTLTFWRLGKVAGWDALFYAAAQLAGGLAGALLVAGLLGRRFLDPPVSAVVTRPGDQGAGAALAAEVAITFLLMSVVLVVSNAPRLSRYTGLFVGALVCAFITFEAPLSGMSMNPARTFASALPGNVWTAAWVYFAAPPLGMLAAAQVYLAVRGRGAVRCAKMHHGSAKRCIFCGFPGLAAKGAGRAGSAGQRPGAMPRTSSTLAVSD